MIKPFFLQITVAADTASAVAGAEELPTTGTLSVLDLIAGGGIFIMGPLGILSVIAIYIFIERFLAIQKAQSLDPSFMNKMKDFIHEGKMQSAQELCKKTTTPFARMLLKGVNRIGKPLNDISASIENVGKLEIYILKNHYPHLLPSLVRHL